MSEEEESKYKFKEFGKVICGRCESEDFGVNFIDQLLQIYCKKCRKVIFALVQKTVFAIYEKEAQITT